MGKCYGINVAFPPNQSAYDLACWPIFDYDGCGLDFTADTQWDEMLLAYYAAGGKKQLSLKPRASILAPGCARRACRSGGTGRRGGLKILCRPVRRPGSTPGSGTTASVALSRALAAIEPASSAQHVV